jgi:hypothetical protein
MDLRRFYLGKAIGFLVVLAVVAAGALAYQALRSPSEVACTTEAKLCPDGTAVGRSGPKCEFSTCPAAVTGTIYGQVLLGPTCPVERYPPDPACADKPFATKLALTTADGATVVKEFSSDQNGNYRVSVQPGTYAIRSAAVANILPYCGSSAAFKLSKGQILNIPVTCDTGIR